MTSEGSAASDELPTVIDGVDWQSAAVALTFLTCPYRNGIGICHAGCRDEPECRTCEPEGGWAQQLREAVTDESPT